MVWMFLLAVVLGAVFFKLGVYSAVVGLTQPPEPPGIPGRFKERTRAHLDGTEDGV